jgi:repressor LexA
MFSAALSNATKERPVVVRPLTDRQQAILDYIIETTRTRGYPPTLREIGQAFGIRSTKGVNDHLEALEKKGRIRRQKDLSRAIEVVGVTRLGGEVSEVPVLGRIAAGAPLLATENVETSLFLDRSLLHGDQSFLLRVQGDSMVGAHICDGDYVLVRPQETAEDGEIVAALLDDEATVKRFWRDPEGVRLEPENPSLQAIRVAPDQQFRILGKVVGVLRVLR